MIMTMIMVNINEAKAKLSEYLDAVARGEQVLICNRNQPVAELHAVPNRRTEPRPIGGAAGRVTVPPTFFDPLPGEWLDAFNLDGPVPASKVAEDAPPYATRASSRKKRR